MRYGVGRGGWNRPSKDHLTRRKNGIFDKPDYGKGGEQGLKEEGKRQN